MTLRTVSNSNSFQPDNVEDQSMPSKSVQESEALDAHLQENLPLDGNSESGDSSDPFDPSALKLSQNFSDPNSVGVEKLLMRVPVHKPNRHDFVRCRPEPEYRIDIAMVELKADREFYPLLPQVAATLQGEWSPYRLWTGITRQGVVFLWPCRLPDADRPNPWHKSLLEAAELACSNWVRITPNMHLGAYEVVRAIGELSAPTWPPHEFRKLLEIGFGKNLVQSTDHPLVGRLLGSD